MPKRAPKQTEQQRLTDARESNVPWRKWGPYLSERQWGTVREDYSPNGDAWNSFPHDHARSRAYRWGEDGIAGISDDKMYLCFALALWNGKDPILKERLFGLTNSEGNHGEDVKEYYFYLDATPTHSYLKMLYKYPQAAYPYDDVVRTNRTRGRTEPEYELLDTGIFNSDRYFDIFVEYAKETPEDLLIRITANNRGPDAAALHLLPQLWFRNIWWRDPGAKKPVLRKMAGEKGSPVVLASHPELGDYYLWCEGSPALLFTENETNEERIFGRKNSSPFVKDAVNDYLLHGKRGAVNPENSGTKVAAHYEVEVKAGGSCSWNLRLVRAGEGAKGVSFGEGFARTFDDRIAEADEFYASIRPPGVPEDQGRVMRQAFAGMIWGKQVYLYDLDRWLEDRNARLSAAAASNVRNRDWFHMVNDDVISMPDKWEYPWFAAWDLAFHSVALAFVDPDFSAGQLELMLQERYLHPNGQIPAYEWNFGDVNPPVHPWATCFNYQLSRELFGSDAIDDLRIAYQKLLMNFTWWVNRKDRNGRNVFEGGFLGLDNIGVFDRSSPLPTGGYLEQADGTAWMALYCQNMLQMSLELALHSPGYEDLAIKFYEHFIWIASAMDRVGEHQDEMWDEEDGFFYDVLRLPDGTATRLKVRSMVGLLPLCAITVYPKDVLLRLPRFVERAKWFNQRYGHLMENINPPTREGVGGRRLLSLFNERKLRRVLRYVLDENEFLSDYGLRSLSRFHLEHPYVYRWGAQEFRVGYLPAESDNGMFGGNSNWRGPIWMPVNLLVIRSLLQLYSYYGNDFQIEFPTGSGKQATLFEVARDIAMRLIGIFLVDKNGRRPVFGSDKKFQTDSYWRDNILFYEYFHGDSGAGLGASHQTGWTGTVGALIRYFGTVTPEMVTEGGVAQASLPLARPNHA